MLRSLCFSFVYFGFTTWLYNKDDSSYCKATIMFAINFKIQFPSTPSFEAWPQMVKH